MNFNNNLENVQRLLDEPRYLLVGFALSVCISAFWLFKKVKEDPIPFYAGEGDPKARWMSDCMNLLREGHQKYGDRPFQVWTTEGNTVILPSKFIDEIKMLSDEKMPSAAFDFMQQQHTTFFAPGRGPIIAQTAKHELNKNMSRLFPLVKEELDLALPVAFPESSEWTPVTFYPAVARLVSQVAGRAFVGSPLNRNEEWIKTSIEYTTDIFMTAAKLREWHPLLRGAAKYLIPGLWRIYHDNAVVERLITPIIKDLEKQRESKDSVKRNDALSWVFDALPSDQKDDYEIQAIASLGYGSASIHTTSQMVTNSVFDLIAHPEYFDTLREEAREVLNESGGEWHLEDMPKLKKLDSFMKEAQRCGGHSMTSLIRKVIKPITLSDGTYLPKGTLLCTASNAISSDPAVYDKPDEFDGLRYYNLRQRSPADEHRHQFVSTSKNMLHFGGGRHACPGRWFASHEIKMILANLILNYDMKMRDGERRPKSILIQAQHIPDPAVSILMKKRNA